MLVNEIVENCDVLVHNKLNSKRLYVESKTTYDGPGEKAQSNGAIFAQVYFAETLKWVFGTRPGHDENVLLLWHVESKIESHGLKVQVPKSRLQERVSPGS